MNTPLPPYRFPDFAIPAGSVPLGGGTFATVWAVLRSDGQSLAVKLSNDPKFNATILKEAELLKLVAESGSRVVNYIPRYKDHGVTDGRAWLLTTLHGQNLREVLSHPRVQVNEEWAVRWMIQLCGILDRLLEDVGLFHLDVKPENILLPSRIDLDSGDAHQILAQQNLMLADFGTVWRKKDGLPQQGVHLGTRDWQPPEGLAGNWHLLSSAFDVYSLGKVFCYLLNPHARLNGQKLPDELSHADALNHCHIEIENLTSYSANRKTLEVIQHMLAPQVRFRLPTPDKARQELEGLLGYSYSPDRTTFTERGSAVASATGEKIDECYERWLGSFVPLPFLRLGAAAPTGQVQVARQLLTVGAAQRIEQNLNVLSAHVTQPYQETWHEMMEMVSKLNEREAGNGWSYSMISEEEWMWGVGLHTGKGTIERQTTRERMASARVLGDAGELPEWCTDVDPEDPQLRVVRGVLPKKEPGQQFSPEGIHVQYSFHCQWPKGALRVVRRRSAATPSNGKSQMNGLGS